MCFRKIMQVGVSLALGWLGVCEAHAVFHTWKINQIYSSADGSVQFIELHESLGFNGENLLAGHFIECISGTTTNTYIFPVNLPSTATANKMFLIGTSNLVIVPGGLTPDYIFTNQVPFLHAGTGTIDYAGVDSVTYTNLPSDGLASMVRSGSTMVFSATNTPMNFSGVSNSVVPVRFAAPVLSGTNLVLRFATATGTNGAAGPIYVIQTNADLTTTNWGSFTNASGNGTVMTLSIPAALPRLFFRLSVP